MNKIKILTFLVIVPFFSCTIQPEEADAFIADATESCVNSSPSGGPEVDCGCGGFPEDQDCEKLVNSSAWSSIFCHEFKNCLERTEMCWGARLILSPQEADSGSQQNEEDPCVNKTSFTFAYWGGGETCLAELQRLGLCMEGKQGCDPCDLSLLSEN